jgi:foldase protein PrsA
MRIQRKLAAIAAFFVIGAAIAGCGSSIPGNSVATVAGNPVSLASFDHWAYVAAKEQAAQYAQAGYSEPPIVSSNPTDFTSCEKALRAGIPSLRSAPTATLKSDCKQVFTSTATTVMNFLIQSDWIQATAHKDGISAAKLAAGFTKAFDKRFPTKAKRDAYLAATLASSGQTLQDLAFTYRVQQLYAKLVKRREPAVTSQRIAAYYAGHKSNFGTPETRDLHLIRTKSQAQAQAAYSALKGGQSWNTVAKKYAADPSAQANGGMLTGISPNVEEAAVSKAIFAASLNQLTGPVKGLFGYYVLQVTKITPATQESLAQATPAIKTQLTSSEQTAAETQVLTDIRKQWKSSTTCRKPNYQTSYCSNYTAPKTTTTATPTTTSSNNTISVGGSTSTTKSGSKTTKKKK